MIGAPNAHFIYMLRRLLVVSLALAVSGDAAPSPVGVDPVAGACSRVVTQQLRDGQALRTGVFLDCANVLRTATAFDITTRVQWATFIQTSSCLHAVRIVQGMYNGVVPPCWVSPGTTTQAVATMSLEAFGTVVLRLPTPSPSTSMPSTPTTSTGTPTPVPSSGRPLPTPHWPDANSSYPDHVVPTMRNNSTDDYSQYRLYFDGASSASIDGSLYVLLAVAVDMLFWDV
ncbi:hypothetical protein SDRG_09740 [Saprolegnia diclina VS20]|uniref:Uncharacterized protein n=1 Tax=Saprolegnia diclina (strain VS20) TaxID=1156394 RepID=T0RKC3_SAPDV|nr:hypothetical protein SDRG_09740 [Saprolegnia diclina VS20]EQC32768.1 hypothetical protein SDRG_09740 [Saprolegnia diclina VS20]|eukprot:XP_008613912.1 hypothetical protein SDRG_09740 [Saprolegnia diclina VS20]